jgi:hypothetical protein
MDVLMVHDLPLQQKRFNLIQAHAVLENDRRPSERPDKQHNSILGIIFVIISIQTTK